MGFDESNSNNPFGTDNPNGMPQGNYVNVNGVPQPTGGYVNQNDVPQGGYVNVNGVPQPTGGFGNPAGAPQGGFANPNGMPQDNFGNPNGMPQDNFGNPNGMPQDGFGNPYGAPQGGFVNMNGMPQGGNGFSNGAPQGGYVNPNDEFQRMNGMPQPTGGFNVDDPNQMGGMNPQPGQKLSLKEKVKKAYNEMNLPNRLTCLRMILVIPFVIFMLAGRAEGLFMVLSLILFVGASITDWLDGYISRSQNLVTNFGKFMDPLADKILVVSAMICLVDLGRLEAWICIIIIAREFIISGFRLVASDNGIVIAASWWGKTKTVSQMIMVILLIVNFASGPLFVLTVIVKYVALALTVISLCDYIYKNRQVLSMQS